MARAGEPKRFKGRRIATLSACVLALVLGTPAASALGYTYSANPSSLGAIPDGTVSDCSDSDSGYGAARDITFTVNGTFDVEKVSVAMTIDHTWVGDLHAVLIAPDNKQVTLFRRVGRTDSNLCADRTHISGQYTFIDSATKTLWAADKTPGSYRASDSTAAVVPMSNLDDFNTNSATGTWTLRIRDGSSGDTGSVSAASLTFGFVPSPTAPTVTSTTPASPANNNSPTVNGTATSSQVALYANASCTGAPVATGVGGSFHIAAPVADNSTTTFHATTTDESFNVTSPCSTSSVTCVEDSTAPSAPTVSGVSPVGPSNSNTPSVTGTAEAGSTVKVYSSAACTGTPLGSGTAAAFAAGGVAVTVPSDATTTLYATATDAAGNASACSTSSVSYTEDSTPPPAPTLSSTSPGSPANENHPKVVGSAPGGATVKLYDNDSCTGTPIATDTPAHFASPESRSTSPTTRRPRSPRAPPTRPATPPARTPRSPTPRIRRRRPRLRSQ